MKTLTSRYFAILPVLFLFAAFACTKDTTDPYRPPGPEQATVKFAITVPSQVAPNTRAMAEEDENEIKTIEVLTFKQVGATTNYELVHIAYCNNITSIDASKREFEVTLMKEENVKLMILANCRDHLTGLVMGGANPTTLDEASELLHVKEEGKWISRSGDGIYIPMWGRTAKIDINESTSLTGISLIRMVAKIDVELTEPAAYDYFKLQSVRLYNHNTRGTIMPAVNTWTDNQIKATSPHLPDGSFIVDGPGTANGVDDPLHFDAADGVQDTAMLRTIYTFEAAAGSNANHDKNTCLVVGGEYSRDGKVYYYRVDFARKENNEVKYMPLLRNHRYWVKINEVSGPGFLTPEEAFNSKPINIQAEVIEWNDGEFKEFAFDGQNKLGVNQSYFELYMDEYDTDLAEILKVVTDVETGWEITVHNDEEGTQDVSDDPVTGSAWLYLDKYSGTKNDLTGGDEIKIMAAENTGASSRTAYLRLQSGRLIYIIRVKQTTERRSYLEVRDYANAIITEMVFSMDDPTLTPAPQTFEVKWAPEDLDVAASALSSPQNPFNLSWFTDNIISGGNHTYTVTPDALGIIPPDNPFFEKTARLDFELATPSGSLTQSLILRQNSPYLTTSADSDVFLMDGTVQQLRVRANFNWQVKFVNDPTDVLKVPFETQTGGYNTTTGNIVTFSLKDFLSSTDPSDPKEADIQVQFSRLVGGSYVDYGGPVTLHCVTAVEQEPANSYMVDINSPIPIKIPIHSHLNRAITGIVNQANNFQAKAAIPGTWLNLGSGQWAAAVLWSDRPLEGDDAVVKKVMFSGDPEVNITAGSDAGIVVVPGKAEGNAVVILFEDTNGDGMYTSGETIKWSWHIWNTPYVPDITGMTLPNSVNDNSSERVTNGRVFLHHNGYQRKTIFMDRNLGAVGVSLDGVDRIEYSSNDKKVATFGMHYQWGRKDPFPGSTTVAGTEPVENTDIFYPAGSPAKRVVGVSAPSQNTLQNSILNPLVFYSANTTNINWEWYTNTANRNAQNDNLWGGGTSDSKTVFDPCPPGWRVPKSTTNTTANAAVYGLSPWARTGVLETGYAKYTPMVWDNGYYFDEATYHLGWYPGAGNRNANGGGLNNVGTNGYYWAATTVSAGSNPQYASYLHVYTGNVNPANSNNRANGFSVRCVAEISQ